MILVPLLDGGERGILLRPCCHWSSCNGGEIASVLYFQFRLRSIQRRHEGRRTQPRQQFNGVRSDSWGYLPSKRIDGAFDTILRGDGKLCGSSWSGGGLWRAAVGTVPVETEEAFCQSLMLEQLHLLIGRSDLRLNSLPVKCLP
jgi:hypothetical protein